MKPENRLQLKVPYIPRCRVNVHLLKTNQTGFHFSQLLEPEIKNICKKRYSSLGKIKEK